MRRGVPQAARRSFRRKPADEPAYASSRGRSRRRRGPGRPRSYLGDGPLRGWSPRGGLVFDGGEESAGDEAPGIAVGAHDTQHVPLRRASERGRDRAHGIGYRYASRGSRGCAGGRNGARGIGSSSDTHRDLGKSCGHRDRHQRITRHGDRDSFSPHQLLLPLVTLAESACARWGLTSGRSSGRPTCVIRPPPAQCRRQDRVADGFTFWLAEPGATGSLPSWAQGVAGVIVNIDEPQALRRVLLARGAEPSRSHGADPPTIRSSGDISPRARGPGSIPGPCGCLLYVQTTSRRGLRCCRRRGWPPARWLPASGASSCPCP